MLFTTTSGTTEPKHIPMTSEGKRGKSRLMWLWLSALYRDHPGIVGGRMLSVVSPEIESSSPGGILRFESGHAYRTMPGPVKSMYTASYGVFAIEDYEAKYYTLLWAGRRPGHQLHRHRQPEHDHPAGRPARTPRRSHHP